jgi:hypothetical protein
MSKYTSFSSLINDFRNSFTSSDKPELGIFWLSDDLTEVIHSRTILEDDNTKDPYQYSFIHCNEWFSCLRRIPGEYTDYPRGRIFHQDNQYVVEVNCPIDKPAEYLICKQFSLPGDFLFKVSYLIE